MFLFKKTKTKIFLILKILGIKQIKNDTLKCQTKWGQIMSLLSSKLYEIFENRVQEN